jgi:hypothetical protein
MGLKAGTLERWALGSWQTQAPQGAGQLPRPGHARSAGQFTEGMLFED